MVLLRAIFFLLSYSFSSSSSKTKKLPSFCPQHHFQEYCLFQKAALPLYSCISNLRDGIGLWDLHNTFFFPYKEQLELFSYLLLPAGFTRPPRGGTADWGTSRRQWFHLHLATSVMVPILSHLLCPPCHLSCASQGHYQDFFCQLHQELTLLLLGQKYCWRL